MTVAPARYWAQDPDPKRVAEKMATFHGVWTIWGHNPINQAWVRNIISYYSTILEPASWDTSLVFEGQEGELVKMMVPQARSLIRQLVTIITKQKLAIQAIAEVDEQDVVQQSRLANALAEQVIEEQQVDNKRKRLAEHALVTGQAFYYVTWRTDIGQPFTRDFDGNFIYTGGIDIKVPTCFDVFYDFTVEDPLDWDWVEVRTIKNRYSLIAQHPDLEDKILALPSVKSSRGPYTWNANLVSDDDNVYCYEFFHRPCPAMPVGRMTMYSDERTIYFDGPNHYECLPVSVMRPEPIIGMGFGYPVLSNLLPAQEMMDHSFSAIATNQSALAIQSVTIPRGSGISVQEIGGMNFISYTPQNAPGGGKPEALQLCQTPPETFKFIDVLNNYMQQLSNLNSALRGEPPPGVTSGVAIATLTTNALEFVNSISQAEQMATEKCMKLVLNAYQRFAKVPHDVSFNGGNGQSRKHQFVGNDLDNITAIKMSVGNPLMQTMAGRIQIADKLLETGFIQTPQAYVEILEGAPLQRLYKVQLREEDLIQKEDEALQQGKPVRALSTDDHPAHIQRHACLLNDTNVRMNATYTQAILNHIEEHLQLQQSTDPMLMAMVRTGKAPMGAPPPPPPGGGAGSGNPAALASIPGGKAAQPAADMLGRGPQGGGPGGQPQAPLPGGL